MRKRWFWILPPTVVLFAALHLYTTSRAAEMPAGKQAVFLARVLAYDGNLKNRAGEAINIGILAQRGDSGSESMAAEIAKALGSLGVATLVGLPLRASRIYWGSRDSLERAVKEGGIDELYVCSGLDAHVSEIRSVARALRVMTVASSEKLVQQGLALGVFVVNGKNTILVNLEASREEGVAFGPDFLRLATVVK
jgi:YfiR/HmsC-like